MGNFYKVSGMLTDVLREQKRLYTEKVGTGKNDVALAVEDMINEANLSASQADYDTSYDALGKAHETILASIRQLHSAK